MAIAETHIDEHHDDHHDHGEFIAHHFESPEQQFDSGKLGIWIFLVTEVLFFSGLFVLYTLYRNYHPEIFQVAHHYLDKNLGCLNTIVLLFSSLTMALAVRSAQTGKNKNCETYLLITMVCATIFLGVKAVEYSHKWDLGIFPRSMFHYHEGVHETGLFGLSNYLIKLSVIPTLLTIGFAGYAAFQFLTDKANNAKFYVGMTIMMLGYFAGVLGGVVYQNAIAGDSHAHAAIHTAGPLMLHAATLEESHDDHDHSESEGHDDSHDAAGHEGDHSGDHHEDDPAGSQTSVPDSVGIFFSIYYCMTGLHAIHIIGGIVALAWLYRRSQLGHWREDYFGPVDYVGLYWHLVDLIWIYLFPLLYLID